MAVAGFKFEPASADTYQSSTVPAAVQEITATATKLLTGTSGKSLPNVDTWWTGPSADGYKVLLGNANTAIARVLAKLQEDLAGIIRDEKASQEAYEAQQKARHESTTWQ